MIYRNVNSNINYIFICQSAEWQIAVLSDSEENACTKAIEIIVNEKKTAPIGKYIFCLKVRPFDDSNKTENWKSFYSPMILANAGFHTEAKKLINFLNER